MEELPFRIFVGVDWGDREHQVCCVVEGKPRQRRFDHSGIGITALVSWLMELCERRPDTVAIAIETPHGVLVDALLEHGFAVFAINPKQLDRFRDRFNVAGAKDDRRDALVLASSLHTDPQAFRQLNPEDPLILQLREFTRAYRNLERENRRLSNQLRGQLNRFFPQILQLSKAADEPWVWSLLERFPSPNKIRHAHHRSVERILREHHISRVTAVEALETLKSPPLPVTEGVVKAATQHIALLLPRLRLVSQQRRHCEQHMARLVRKVAEAEDAQPGPEREHRDVEILLSQPGVGDIVAATVLAEAHQPLVQRNYHALRACGGIAPFTGLIGIRGTLMPVPSAPSWIAGSTSSWPVSRADVYTRRTTPPKKTLTKLRESFVARPGTKLLRMTGKRPPYSGVAPSVASAGVSSDSSASPVTCAGSSFFFGCRASSSS